MKVFRTVTVIALVTLTALIYVHQQVELVKLSYVIGFKEKKLKDMLDRNEGLGYNIANLEDPTRLEQVLLSKNIEISFPRQGNVVRAAKALCPADQANLGAIGIERPFNIFGVLEIFSPRAEAQTRDRL
jgi:hypothetical protein